MARQKGARRREAREEAHAERCIFCRFSEKLSENLEKHSGAIQHLDNAKKELLAAVQEFVDSELESLEKTLKSRKGKRRRVTRVEVRD